MKIFRRALLLIVLFPLIIKADELVAVDIKRLSFESTVKIVQSAIAACRKQTIQIAVVVIDRGGNIQLAARDTLAVDLTLRIAEQKAYTALSFNSSTSILATRTNSRLNSLDGLLMLGGGLPIEVGGVIYGAIGVSGAPSPDVDEKCATAGLNAIIEDLEMSQ